MATWGKDKRVRKRQTAGKMPSAVLNASRDVDFKDKSINPARCLQMSESHRKLISASIRAKLRAYRDLADYEDERDMGLHNWYESQDGPADAQIAPSLPPSEWLWRGNGSRQRRRLSGAE